MNRAIIKAQTNKDTKVKNKMAHQITFDECDELNNEDEMEIE